MARKPKTVPSNTPALAKAPARDWSSFFSFLYLALVCFASGVALCVYVGSSGYQLILSTWPQLEVESRMADPYRPKQIHAPSMEQFSKSDREALESLRLENLSEAGWATIADRRPEDETKQRESLTNQTIWQARKNLVEDLLGLLVAALVFTFHWRIFKGKI